MLVQIGPREHGQNRATIRLDRAPVNRGVERRATVEQPRLAAMQQYELIKARIMNHPQGEQILREFDAISDLNPAVAAAG